jgi:hypothetical protein
MNHHRIFGAVLLACTGFCADSALAQDCEPLKLITSTNLIPAGDLNLVPVSINGVPKNLFLDTGGYMSQVSRQTVDELKMSLHDSAVPLADLSGNVSRSFVIADTLTLGTLTARQLPLIVSTFGQFIRDGIFSNDLLLRYDVELDFPGRKMSYFLPDHCKGKVVYWHPPVVAAIPITVANNSRLMVPVELDGKTFQAMIDTGASRTTIPWAVARYIFGLDATSPDMQPVDKVNGDPKLASYMHTFHR